MHVRQSAQATGEKSWGDASSFSMNIENHIFIFHGYLPDTDRPDHSSPTGRNRSPPASAAATAPRTPRPASAPGAALPLLFDRLGLDPALMSAPFIATATDVAGVFIYLQTASWLLQRAAPG